MTSTNARNAAPGKAVDYQKLGPALLIASCLVLAIRTARWAATVSDGLADRDWQEEVEHSARLSKRVLSLLVSRHAELFPQRDVPRYEPADKDVAR